jgi:hypothetical protein
MLVEWLAHTTPPVLDSNLRLETACPDFYSYLALINLSRQKVG